MAVEVGQKYRGNFSGDTYEILAVHGDHVGYLDYGESGGGREYDWANLNDYSFESGEYSLIVPGFEVGKTYKWTTGYCGDVVYKVTHIEDGFAWAKVLANGRKDRISLSQKEDYPSMVEVVG